MNDKEHDKVIDLIQKLLNLSKSDNENEASLAMERAQKLLFQHNLTIDQVRAEKGETENLAQMIIEDSYCLGNGQYIGWKRRLASDIAWANFCRLLYSENFVFFIGTRQNVDVVKEMFTWIVEQGERMSLEAVHTKKPAGVDGRVYRSSFLLGLAVMVGSRLTAQFKALKAEATQSTALVVRNDKAVEEWIQHKYPKLPKAKAESLGRISDGGGYCDGKVAGQNVSLTRTRQLRGG